MFENYTRVRLITDKYRSEGAEFGDIGYIIEVYHDAYEVEFSDKSGATYAQIVARDGDLEVSEPAQKV